MKKYLLQFFLFLFSSDLPDKSPAKFTLHVSILKNVCTCKPCKVHTCIIVYWSWNLQKLLEIMNIFETTVLYNVHCFAKRKVNDWVICVTDLDNNIFSDNERQYSILIGPYLFISQLWLVLIFSSHWAVSFSSASKTNFKLNKI